MAQRYKQIPNFASFFWIILSESRDIRDWTHVLVSPACFVRLISNHYFFFKIFLPLTM